MQILALIVGLASVVSGHDCGAVNPQNNIAAWINKGSAYTAHYNDLGDSLKWNRKVPRYVKHLATDNTGTAIRLQCGH